MAEVLEDILNDIDKVELDEKILKFKEHIKSLDLIDVMFPIGVKNVKKYTRKGDEPFTPRMKGTPVHVKAALNYNDMLRHHNIRTWVTLPSDFDPQASLQGVEWLFQEL